MEVRIADDSEYSARAERAVSISEHLPSGEVSDRIALVKGRVTQHRIERRLGLILKAIGPKELSFVLKELRIVGAGTVDGHLGFVAKRDVRFGMLLFIGDSQHTVSASEV